MRDISSSYLQRDLQDEWANLASRESHVLSMPQRTQAGTSTSMTLGWHIGTVDAVRCFYKEGGGGGFHSMMRVYPSAGIATVVMTNATAFSVGELLDNVDHLFLSSTGVPGGIA